MRGDGRDGRGGGGGNQPPPLTKGYPGRGGGLGRPSGLEGQRVPGASATPSPGRETADERRLAEAQQAAPQPKPRPVTVTARSAPAQAPTPIEAPTPSLPKGGGALRSIAEAFTVSPSGSGQMAIPLPLSPGRAGFGPELRLSYDTGAGNGDFGLGWSLDVPSIARKTDKALPLYRDDQHSDSFVLSGAETLVPFLDEGADGTWRHVHVEDPEGGRRFRYRPRVEGDFARIERVVRAGAPTYWVVTTKDAVTHVYGRSATARIADPEFPHRIFRWLLEETRDPRGHVVRYEYKAEDLTGVRSYGPDGQFLESWHRRSGPIAIAGAHLKRILYAHKRGVADPAAPDDFHVEVVFDYGEHDALAPTPTDAGDWGVRADPFSTYRPGFEVRSYRLCRRVLVFHRDLIDVSPSGEGAAPNPRLVRALELGYDESTSRSLLTSATVRGYDHDGSGYVSEALPTVTFGYSGAPAFDYDVKQFPREQIQDLPVGIDGRGYQWVDLDGEGVPGVLTQQGGGLYYKRNLGEGQLSRSFQQLRDQPTTARLGDPTLRAQARGRQQLLDVTGDGLPDLVDTSGPAKGYYPRRDDGTWGPFQAFQQLPNLDFSSPWVRFLDLTGDGFADVIMSENQVYTWWPSLGRKGYGVGRRAPRCIDDTKGPTVLFADAVQTIRLADMTGDGLQDLVRIDQGRIGYFPNLGHGRFGPFVLMGGPHMAPCNHYNPYRIRLADLDGTGTADLLYFGGDGIQIWRNQSGNSFGERELLPLFPGRDALSTIDVVDMLGTGTSCIVWSTPFQGHDPRLRYVDLLRSTKPHLLTRIDNGLGLETTIAYTTSTKQSLADRAAGRPWATRLPFPIQVVERLEHHDRISGHRTVSTYRYRHGYYDPEEREFRGFGYVETRDAEVLPEALGKGLSGEDAPPGAVGNERPLPPVVTKTWYHTGAFEKAERLYEAYATEWTAATPDPEDEPRLGRPRLEQSGELGQALAVPKLSAIEHHQASRALAGQLLRQEIYAEDGSPDEARPYAVTQATQRIRALQPAASPSGASNAEGGPYAAFLVVPTETLTLTTERQAALPPRIAHELTLEVDAFGAATKRARVAYGWGAVPLEGVAATLPEQAATWIALDEQAYYATAAASDATIPGSYRHSLPIEGQSFEVDPDLARAGSLYTTAELRGAWSLAVVPYEAAVGADERRRLRHTHQRYAGESGPYAIGQAGALALPYATYELALTPGLLAGAAYLDGKATDRLDEAGYLDLFTDGNRWAWTGLATYDATAFYQATSLTDVHGETLAIIYDDPALLVTEVTDPLGNTTTATLDYRVLAPAAVTDPNGHTTLAAFDPLGRVVATAVTGKSGEGDSLAAPTATFSYELDRYAQHGLPARVRAERRETHADASSRWIVSLTYADGAGHELLTKVLAEDGLAVALDSAGHPVKDSEGVVQFAPASPRWVGTGRTVLNNKGLPIKQYEPYFSPTEEYEDDPDLAAWGVTPLLSYDPLGRLIRVDHPDGTVERITFDPWSSAHHDGNDTADEGQPWYDARLALPSGDPDREAAIRAHAHVDTPTVTRFDALGRPFAVTAHNRLGPTTSPTDEFHTTKAELDIQGQTRVLVDALGRDAVVTAVSMVGQPLATTSLDAGTRKALTTAVGEPVLTWGERGFSRRLTYDALRRPEKVFVSNGTTEALLERRYYGEGHSQAAAKSLRGKLVASFDQAGVVLTDDYDFKGNLLAQRRHLAQAYAPLSGALGAAGVATDWTTTLGTQPSAEVALAAALSASELHAEAFDHAFAYDALDRPTSVVTPDTAEVLPTYNVAGLLEAVDAKAPGASSATAIVTAIDYDEKGRRTSIAYGNGTTTSYTYHPLSFRLVHFKTTRASDGKLLQSLATTYDAVGNIVSTRDTASQDVFFSTAPTPSADATYRYDAVYRLIEATGREHAAAVADDMRDELGLPIHAVPHLNSPNGFRPYTETYAYDVVGNLTSMAHAAGSPGSWTRSYTYASASNRLASTNHPAGTRTYPHDAHGNITQLAHLAALDWDEADRLRHVEVTTGQDVFFAYDGAGRRVRKVYEHSGLREERLYLGGYELYRKTTVSTGTLEVERQTLHVADDHRRVCMVETLTVDGGGAITAPVPRYRFQLDNHLGTACVEVSDAGAVISFEEFHPYGTSSYRSFESSEVSAKRYRYTGKERDEETGLYFHGARYYAPWLGRWMSADPAGTVDGTNLFAYVRGSPVVLSDPTGTEGLEKGLAKAAREAFSSTARALEERRRAAEQTPIPPGEGNWRELRLEAEAPAQQQPRRQQTPPGIVNLTEADVEPFYVEEGMLTFEAEGQEGGRYHSREPHHPTHSSGITIGRGLDLGSFSPEHARQFLDVLLIADEISPFEHFNLTDVIGLHGDNAALAIERVELQGLEISPSAQKHLFEMTYEFMSAEVERISASPATVAEYGAVDFETLDPRIKAVLVDLRFRGDYRPRSRERIQQFAATNDVAGLREAMNDEDFWINQMGVPRDRYNLRRQYLQP